RSANEAADRAVQPDVQPLRQGQTGGAARIGRRLRRQLLLLQPLWAVGGHEMKKRALYIAIVVVVLVAAGIVSRSVSALSVLQGRAALHTAQRVERPARIHPDYSGVVAPPNIAPLNFVVQEDGRRFYVRIAAERGEP